MSQFWKPGTEKPRLLDDEEGGVLFYSAPPSSSSSAYLLLTLNPFSFIYVCMHVNICTIFWVLFFTYRFGYASIEKQRQRLPVYKYRTALLYLVETHSTTIIVGETGSGKTTQIPQVIYFSFRHSVLLYVVSELAYNNSLLEFCSLLNFSVPFVGNNNNNCGSCFILIMWSIPFLEIMNK